MNIPGITRDSRIFQKKLPKADENSKNVETMIAVIGIVATVLSGFIGGKVAADASIAAVREQLDTSSAEADRSKKAEVYSEYLKAVDSYVTASNLIRFSPDFEVVPNPEKVGETAVSLPADLATNYYSAKSAMNGRYSDMFAFGSNDAHEKASALISYLPEFNAGADDPKSGLKFDVAKYSNAYEDFLLLYRQEMQRDRAQKSE